MDGAFNRTPLLAPLPEMFQDLPRRYEAAAVRVLADAFAADTEFVQHFWAGVTPRRRHFVALFRGYYLGHVARYHPLSIRHHGEIVGVANYAHLTPTPAGFWTTLQAVLARQSAKSVLPRVVLERIQTYHQALYFPNVPCFSINQLGIAPQHQGCGFGGRLLAEVVARSAAQATSEGVLVTTFSQAKAAYYERQGFQRLEQTAVDGVWAISLFARHAGRT